MAASSGHSAGTSAPPVHDIVGARAEITREPDIRETIRMAVMALVLFAIAYAALWYAGLFSGLSFHGTIAAVLGVFLATTIGVGLMALLFHSDRSRHDQQVHDSTKSRD